MKPIVDTEEVVNTADDRPLNTGKYMDAALRALPRLIDPILKNQKLAEIFLQIYPLLRDGSEWTSYKLHKAIQAQVPQLRADSSLKYHLDGLADGGFLERAGVKKTVYRLNRYQVSQLHPLQDVVEDPRFREQVEAKKDPPMVEKIRGITTMLQELFPERSPGYIAELTRVFMVIIVDLALLDLHADGTLADEAGSPTLLKPEGTLKSDTVEKAPLSPLKLQILEIVEQEETSEGVEKFTIFHKLSHVSRKLIIDALIELIHQDQRLVAPTPGRFRLANSIK